MTQTQTVTVETVEQFQNLTPEQVTSAYSGTDGKCCCGCAGKHFDSTTMKTRVLRQVQLLAAEGVEVDFGGTYVAAVRGTRLYIVYLAD